ncbi:MAG TPA: hypothetical protein DIT28_05500, partial [Oxalobacteraceae bacterium]|nr:hypothetical protein [Oxalobacteraceae bacterium]
PWRGGDIRITIIIRNNVGIFSLFGKKDRQPADTLADKDSSRKKREESAARTDTGRNSGRNSARDQNLNAKRDATELELTQQVQRKAAQATAMKIDAIESEMSSEFVKPRPPSRTAKSADTASSPKPAARAPSKPPEPAPPTKKKSNTTPTTLELLPLIGSSTAFLLSSETVGGVAISNSENTPVIDEAAILFANDQPMMVEHVLRAAIEDDALGGATAIVWGMLFDLYHATGEQQQFENLSIAYANKFETSPPAWTASAHGQVHATATATAATGAIPSVPFAGRLDATAVKLLERTQNLAEKSRVLRLEFARVTEVDPIGCGLLLRVLKT